MQILLVILGSGFKFLNVHSQEFTGALTGNADTATALETARTINGVSFDGTADITIEASIDKTLFISEGLEDTGGLTQFDGGTDVTFTSQECSIILKQMLLEMGWYQ